MVKRTEPEPERDVLGFAKEVQSAFRFLTDEYGFSCVRALPTFVRYESADVFVNIYQGRISSELGVEIGRKSDQVAVERDWASDQSPIEFAIGRGRPSDEFGPGELHYTLTDVLVLKGALPETEHVYISTHTVEGVRKFVHRLAELVREHAGSALRGDPGTFEQLAEVSSRRSDAYMKEMRLSDTRKEAEAAWRAKDNAAVIDLYESMQEDLTRVESGRLNYARKHL